jgi:hypothetical protein
MSPDLGEDEISSGFVGVGSIWSRRASRVMDSSRANSNRPCQLSMVVGEGYVLGIFVDATYSYDLLHM